MVIPQLEKKESLDSVAYFFLFGWLSRHQTTQTAATLLSPFSCCLIARAVPSAAVASSQSPSLSSFDEQLVNCKS